MQAIRFQESNRRRFFKQVAKISLKIAVLVIVFGLGVGIGDGRIGVSSITNRSIQKNLPAKLDYSSVDEVYNDLKASFDGQLDQSALLDGLKSGLAKAAGDPYTEYMNAKESQDFSNQLSGSFEGIGAELSKVDNNIVIVAPIAGTPADKAGLKPRDIIAEVDGQSTADMTVSEVVSKIRGPKNSVVKLTIVRDGQVIKLSITRDQITIPSVSSDILPGNIGYLKIIRFGDDTGSLAQQAAAKFKSTNVKGVVLDLRGDPGGLLEAAVDVSSLWLKSNQVVLQEKRGGIVINTYYARGNPVLNGLPTVVLVDGGSASASEITAGALHDNKLATIMGVKSFGKGSVQELRELKGGGLLKVTVARWYTPNGRNIDKEGIEPDIKVELSEIDAKAGKDTQKDAAIAQVNKM